MKKVLFALCAVVLLTACVSTGEWLRGMGQVEQVGAARAALIEYVDGNRLTNIQQELAFLDETNAKVQKLIDGNPNIGLRPAVTLVLGAPSAFNEIGTAYGAIKQEVKDQYERSGTPIPPVLVIFDDGVNPLYGALRDAIDTKDNLKQATELIALLKPVVAVLL